jgi:hypothetical protein
MMQFRRAEWNKMKNILKLKFLVQCSLVVTVLISVSGFVYSAELEQTFPPDVQQFISDREGCDHFRSEPRDFDESYKRKFGKKAEQEEAERAAFLEKMTAQTCHQMDKRLLSLVKKYSSDKIISDKLDQYEYLDIGTVYVLINKDFPNAELIRKKLIAKGFFSNYVELYSNPELPVLTVQIGSAVAVHTAQRFIETLLKYGPNDIGVVLLPKTSHSYYASRIQVGLQPVGNYQVYLGNSIQNLLSSDLTQEDFEKFAKLMEPEPAGIECSKELAVCKNREGICLRVEFDTSKCNMSCQAEISRKLYSVGILPDVFSFSTKHFSCVGYRKDKGGTEKGAQCLANLLGYKQVMAATAAYESEGCFTYDMPYFIWAH